jgi:heterodisulfide reductase subunit A
MDMPNTENRATESDSAKEGMRVGVYVCHCGGNISDVVDVERVIRAASKLPGVAVAKHYMFMCSDPGQIMVAEDIAKENLDRVVIAACAPSLHEGTFRGVLNRAGLNPYLYEAVNIREQVSWVSHADPEGATDKAIRLVAVGVAKARRSHKLQANRIDANKRVAVVGGGVGGLRCARDLSRNGYQVTLIEKAPFLGGRMVQLGSIFPLEDKARELLKPLLDEVLADANITIHTSAEIIDVSGYIGDFTLTVSVEPRGVTAELSKSETQAAIDACPETTENEFDYGLSQRKAIYLRYPGCYPAIPAIDWRTCTKCGKCVEAVGGKGIKLDAEGEEMKVSCGMIALATGFEPYQPKQGEYGFGVHPEVITLPQLERMLDEEGPTGGKLVLNGKPVRNVSMIHCVGSRQVEGIHEPGPDGRVNDYCSRYCCTAALRAVNELRRRFPNINVYDFYQDIRTYGRGHEDYYLASSKLGVLFFRWLPEQPPVVEEADGRANSPLFVRVKDTLTWGEELIVPSDLVVLATGMVPSNIDKLVDIMKLPRSPDRFLQEVHPKLRPVELAVSGVIMAGSCQGPMDITETCAAASTATTKAVGMLEKGYIELDPFIAQVDLDLCKGEGLCVAECTPMNAITLVERDAGGKQIKQAEVNAALCNGCGMCVAVCPHSAIQVAGWRIDQFDAMVDALVGDYETAAEVGSE